MLGRSHSKRIGTMVMNVLESSVGQPEVKMTGEVLDATNKLKDYMYANVYTMDTRGNVELHKAQFMLKELFRLYMGSSQMLLPMEDLAPRGVRRPDRRRPRPPCHGLHRRHDRPLRHHEVQAALFPAAWNTRIHE